jgi:hypothetical protein
LSNKSYSNYFRTSSSCISGCDIPSKSVALCRKGLRNPNENLAQCAWTLSPHGGVNKTRTNVCLLNIKAYSSPARPTTLELDAGKYHNGYWTVTTTFQVPSLPIVRKTPIFTLPPLITTNMRVRMWFSFNYEAPTFPLIKYSQPRLTLTVTSSDITRFVFNELTGYAADTIWMRSWWKLDIAQLIPH